MNLEPLPCAGCGYWFQAGELDEHVQCAQCQLEREMAELAARDASWCVHCDAEPRAYANGMGRACSAYVRKTGRLPSEELLRRRTERAVDRELARAVAGPSVGMA